MTDNEQSSRLPRWKRILATGTVCLGIPGHDAFKPNTESLVQFKAPAGHAADGLARQIIEKTTALQELIPEVATDIRHARHIGFNNLWTLRKGIEATLIPAHEHTNGTSFFTLQNNVSQPYALPGIHKLVSRCIEIEALQQRMAALKSHPDGVVSSINYEALVRKIADTQPLPTPQKDIEAIALVLREVAQSTSAALPLLNDLPQKLGVCEMEYGTPIGRFPININIKNPLHYQNLPKTNPMGKAVTPER